MARRKQQPALILERREARAFGGFLRRDGFGRRSVESEGPRGPSRSRSIQSPPSKGGNSTHVQTVEFGDKVAFFAHREPDPVSRPLGHIRGALTGAGVDWSQGKRDLRRKYAEFSEERE